MHLPANIVIIIIVCAMSNSSILTSARPTAGASDVIGDVIGGNLGSVVSADDYDKYNEGLLKKMLSSYCARCEKQRQNNDDDSSRSSNNNNYYYCYYYRCYYYNHYHYSLKSDKPTIKVKMLSSYVYKERRPSADKPKAAKLKVS